MRGGNKGGGYPSMDKVNYDVITSDTNVEEGYENFKIGENLSAGSTALSPSIF